MIHNNNNKVLNIEFFIQFNSDGFITFDDFLSTSVRPLNMHPASNSQIVAPFWLPTEPRCGDVTYDVVYKKDNSNGEINKVFVNVNEDILNADVTKLSTTFDAETVVIYTFKGVGPTNSAANCPNADVSGSFVLLYHRSDINCQNL